MFQRMLGALMLELKEDVGELKAESPIEEGPVPKFTRVEELTVFSPDHKSHQKYVILYTM